MRKNVAIAEIDHQKFYDVILQTWIIEYLKMYKKSDEIINFLRNVMENWRMELKTERSTNPSRSKKSNEASSRETIQPLHFVTAMMPKFLEIYRGLQIYKITRKVSLPYLYGWYKDICHKWKGTGDAETSNKNILSGYRNWIWRWKMCHSHNKKWRKRNRGTN